MASTTATVSLTTAFVDLSTYDEIECFLYGGRSVNKFRKIIRKSSWFTVIAAQLNRCGTTGDFNTEMQAMFSRAGDYIRDCWLRVQTPLVRSKPGFQARWTRNLGHNIIEEAYLHYNDLTVNKLTNYHMDFLHAFMCPAGKINGYENMIGNIDPLINPYEEYTGHPAILTPGNPTNPTGQSVDLPSTWLNIPLPFYFCNDPSDAIIQAACPFNDVRITIKFRDWRELLLVDSLIYERPVGSTDLSTTAVRVDQPTWSDVLQDTNLRLQNCQIWAHYAVIPNGDREKIADECEIDTVISQIQSISPSSVGAGVTSRGIDLRFAHSIRAIYFAMRNTTIRSEWSNYSTHIPRGVGSDTGEDHGIVMRPTGTADPIARAVLQYENVDRVNMDSDYYTLVAPWFSAERIPEHTGYHLLSYANRLNKLEPDGSTNFARLASVNLNLVLSDTAIAQMADPNTAVELWSPEYHATKASFDIIITASSLSVLRFQAGSAGFPVI